jgi:hypothetical protein
MSRWTMASPPPLGSSLSVAITYEHAYSELSSTCPLLIGRGSKPGEPDNLGPATLGSMTPRNPGAGSASPWAVCPGVLVLEPRITKSKHRPPTAASGRGFAPSASTLSAPSRLSLATASTRVGIPCKRGALLPSRACILGASYACITGAFCACVVSASCADSSSSISSNDSPSTNVS